jgi:LacI family transcriptional regulator, gluconate utilization system Gnt-I transcriptional repressor
MSDRAPDPKRRRKTLSDVAVRAGVSAVTVSRALHRPEMVSVDLRERIESAVHELAYIPNQLASALASARTDRIGVIVPSLTNGVFGDYLRALHDVFLPAGFQVLVLNSGYVAGKEERAIATMLGQHPEAMIITGIDQTSLARRMLAQAEIPVIQTMEVTDKPIDIAIGLSQHDAGYAATRHLIELGHRHIGQMAVPLDARASQRLDGYRRAMAEAGLEPLHVSMDGPSSFVHGAQLLAEMVVRWPAMTGLFTGNDNLALGAVFECQRRGIRVPEDLSIVGFNDLEYSAVAFPSLTTVATPRYRIGERAAEIVLQIIRGSGERPPERCLDLGFKLIPRGSTQPPRKAETL